MLGHYTATALRNFQHNLAYRLMDVACLAVGIAVAIVIGLFVFNELHFDDFLVHGEQTWRIWAQFKRGNASLDTSQKQLAQLLRLDYPSDVAGAARLLRESRGIRNGDVEGNEDVYWADPNTFAVLGLAPAAGNLAQALSMPTGIVITQRIARRYFGREDVVGRTLELDRQYPFVVTAVLEDLPSNTHLDTNIFIAGHAAVSPLKALDTENPGDISAPVYTYFRLTPQADVRKLEQDLPAFIDRHWPISSGTKMSVIVALHILPVRDIHLHSRGLFSMRPASDVGTVAALALVGVLILAAACINFINMATARSSRRSIEVGVRKCFGAFRTNLVWQFLGETCLLVAIAFAVALLLVALALPVFNAFIDRDITFHWWSSPAVLVGLLAAIALVGTLAGLYPAFVLSAFLPASVLRNAQMQASGVGILRRVLIVVQCSILAGLLVATATIRMQMRYAMEHATGPGKEPIVIVNTDCQGPFPEAVRHVAGVRAAACSQSAPTNRNKVGTLAARPDVESLQIDYSIVDFDFFELYHLEPLAGRLFSRQHPADAVPVDPAVPFHAPIVLNETAVRKFGFASAAAAIGQYMTLFHTKNPQPSQIVGVVPDFLVDSLREPVAATAYFVDPSRFKLLSIALDPGSVGASLAGIDRIWNEVSTNGHPIDRFFIEDYLQHLNASIHLEGEIFTGLSLIAALIACAGLLSLAAFTAQQRTREIGIRKTLGAETSDIVRLLLLQFGVLIAWANVLAWPVTAYLLHGWLQGFAYRLDLQWWLFGACGLVTLAIALVVVSGHTYLAARTRPIYALRHE